MFGKLKLLPLITLMLAPQVTAPAIAADGKTYPGTICQYWTADENANRNKMEVSQFGWVGNAADANRRLGVVCPLIRDSQRAGIERVFVRVVHRNCANIPQGGECPRNTECNMRVMHVNGQDVRNRPDEPIELVRWTEGATSDAYMLLNIEGISVPDFTNAEDITQGSMFVLFCRLAPSAAITSIYVGEGT